MTTSPKKHYYSRNIGDLKRRLREHLDLEELATLHRLEPWKHWAVAGGQTVLFTTLAVVLYRFSQPWIWVPAAILQGFVILGFIILLHEHVHTLIHRRGHRRLLRLVGYLYALPSGISPTQFRIWHLDHHRELGSADDDPKRAHLSPKRNARWLKLLYFTPALFVIYARAAAREARTYSTRVRRVIRRERLFNVTVHAAVAVAIGMFGGWEALLRAHLIPLFVCFPPAFFLNRLGQHYDVRSEEPAAWSTLVNGNPLWRFLFLWSNHHIEHHYYPGVPFYRLTRLNRRLQGFFREHGIHDRKYRQLVKRWLVDNRAPHTDWS